MATLMGALNLFGKGSKPVQNFNNTLNVGLADISNTLNLGITDITNTLNLELTKVTNTLNQTVNNFNQTLNQTHNTFQTIVYVQNEVAKAEEKITDGIEKTTEAQENLNKSVEKSGSKISDFLKKFNTESVIEKLKSAKSFTEDYMDTFSRLDSINDNLQTTKQLQDKVFASAQRSGGSYMEIANSIGKMGQAALSAFKSNDELIAFHELMQKSFRVGGVQPENQQAVTDQITSIMASGTMGKSDFSTLLDTAPQIIDSLSNYTGKSKSELMDLAASGAITADVLKNSMFAASGDIEDKFSQMPMTVGDSFNILKNSALSYLDPVIAKMNEFFNSDAGQLIAQLWAMVAPIAAQAIAWMVANWPITLIILAVGALVGALLYFGVSAEQIVGFVTGVFFALYAYIYNTVALLYNLFASFVEFLANLFIDPIFAVKKLIYDLAMTFGGYMYNMLRSAEDFAGGFMKVIIEGINGALKGFNKLVEGVNKIFGTKFSTANLFDADNIHAISDSFKGLMDGMEEPVSNKDLFKVNRMEYKQTSEYFAKGNTLGAGLTGDLISSVKGQFDNFGKKGMQFTPDPYGSNGLTNPMGGANPSGGFASGAANANSIPNVGRVDKVGQVENSVDISSEDLKMMRELAEMKSIQNFVSLTPTVQVTTGPVNNGADIDTIVARIEQTLEEEIAASAAGVYG
ncbi:tape measure protein [Paenibacillus motobuensis]|uniref:Tape measure protein N-terminal domain-containing protein n=1 Tax=Paenibacillus motobuensis TaxID=295324 RepID=A0ABP3I3F4_9BACL